jgi:Dimerisation domain
MSGWLVSTTETEDLLLGACAMVNSPEYFLNELLGYQTTAALKAAIELDLFSALAASGGDLGQVSERTGASEKGIRILCDYLTVKGFLEKDNGQHRLTSSSQTFLTRASPAYIGRVADFLASPEMIGLWLTEPSSFVRKGGPWGWPTCLRITQSGSSLPGQWVLSWLRLPA